MRISIITVSYNQGKFLRSCIESILDQGYHDLQYIIIDGGSTDNSVEIIQEYSESIDYWISENDQGAAHALNKGLSKVDGELVGYINSDDYLLPGALKKLFEICAKHPDVDVYYGPGEIRDEINGTTRLIYPTKWNLGLYRSGLTVMMQQSMFIRRRCFDQGLLFNQENTTHWDGELLVDLDLAGARFLRHPIPIGGFRIHQGSIAGGARGEQGKIAYNQQRELLESRIDDTQKVWTHSRVLWFLWLMLFDSRTMLRRVYYRIFQSSKNVLR